MRRSWICALLLAGCSFTVSGNPVEPPDDAPPEEPDAPPDVPPPPTRVGANLIGLWDFNEGAGTVVADTSGRTPPVNLTIVDPASFTWGTGSLNVVAPGDLATPTGAYPLISRLRVSDQVTLEAWVTPANLTQTATSSPGQPARVVSFTVRNAGQHLLGIGQDRDTWVGQVRTAAAGLDGHGGTPSLRMGPAQQALTHLVVTSTPTQRRLYVNGVAVSDDKGGVLDAWKDTFVLIMGGDPVKRNTWLGTLHLIAMYDAALSADDVMTNYLAGP